MPELELEQIPQKQQSMNVVNKRGPVILMTLLALAVILAGFYYLNSQQLKTEIKTTPPSVNPPSSPSVRPAEARVIITKDGFSPATILIKQGMQVTWQNLDKSPHQVASDPHPAHTGLEGFDSLESLATSESFSFTFEKTGTFNYHDHLNPTEFKGTIIAK